MKTDNIFDLMYDDPDGIDRKVTGKTGVSIDNVQRLVNRKTGAETKAPKKKHSRRKLAAALIAAALSVVILCSTATATGLMDTVFGGKVEVKTDSITITATPVEVESDDLNIVLDGITGDTEEVYATFTITKKDGSNFIDGINDVSNTEINNNFRDKCELKVYTASAEDEKLQRNSQYGIVYTLVDSKTINAFISVNKDLTPLDIISVSNSCIVAKRYIKTVHQFDCEEFYEKMDDTHYFFNDENKKEYIDQLIEEYKPHFNENEKVGFDSERCAVIVYEEYTIPLKYNITFTAGFSGKSIDLISEPIYVKGDDWGFIITRVTASNTGMWIYAEEGEGYEYKPLFAEDYLTLNLKDGKTVKADMYFGGAPYDPQLGYNDGTKGEFKYSFGYRQEGIVGMTYTPVDPTEIESIVVGGVIVELNTK